MNSDPSSVDRLGQLLQEAKIPYSALKEGNGFSISATAASIPVKPILLAEQSTVWLLAALDGPILVGAEIAAAKDAANDINKEIPFGAFYVERGNIFFRNSVRWLTLNSRPDEISVFIFSSLSVIDQKAKYLRRIPT